MPSSLRRGGTARERLGCTTSPLRISGGLRSAACPTAPSQQQQGPPLGSDESEPVWQLHRPADRLGGPPQRPIPDPSGIIAEVLAQHGRSQPAAHGRLRGRLADPPPRPAAPPPPEPRDSTVLARSGLFSGMSLGGSPPPPQRGTYSGTESDGLWELTGAPQRPPPRMIGSSNEVAPVPTVPQRRACSAGRSVRTTPAPCTAPRPGASTTPASASGSELGELLSLQRELVPLLRRHLSQGAAPPPPPAHPTPQQPNPPPPQPVEPPEPRGSSPVYYLPLPKPLRPTIPPPQQDQQQLPQQQQQQTPSWQVQPQPEHSTQQQLCDGSPARLGGAQRRFDPQRLNMKAAEPVWGGGQQSPPRHTPEQYSRPLPAAGTTPAAPNDFDWRPRPCAAPAPPPAAAGPPAAAPAAPPSERPAPSSRPSEAPRVSAAAGSSGGAAAREAAAATQPWRRHPAHSMLLELAALHGVSPEREAEKLLRWVADEDLLAALGRVANPGVWLTRYGLQGGPQRRLFSLTRYADNYKRLCLWLVWRDRDAGAAVRGRCPLSELVGLTAGTANTRAFRKYHRVGPNGEEALEGAPRQAEGKHGRPAPRGAAEPPPRLLPAEGCMTLYFRQRPLSVHCGRCFEDCYRVFKAVVEINQAFGRPQDGSAAARADLSGGAFQEGVDDDSDDLSVSPPRSPQGPRRGAL
eukprot:TRINITY_DN8428_c1_g3_i1.p1 TRINITY_DN8428_c1_g3~~TRINITY_DN8428_c1_g3_i1.p1  ORF type:complete len:714 (+),score=152.66 TRINITY_DN8428_c1_g3_i1:76-2142(+)